MFKVIIKPRVIKINSFLSYFLTTGIFFFMFLSMINAFMYIILHERVEVIFKTEDIYNTIMAIFIENQNSSLLNRIILLLLLILINSTIQRIFYRIIKNVTCSIILLFCIIKINIISIYSIIKDLLKFNDTILDNAWLKINFIYTKGELVSIIKGYYKKEVRNIVFTEHQKKLKIREKFFNETNYQSILDIFQEGKTVLEAKNAVKEFILQQWEHVNNYFNVWSPIRWIFAIIKQKNSNKTILSSENNWIEFYIKFTEEHPIEGVYSILAMAIILIVSLIYIKMSDKNEPENKPKNKPEKKMLDIQNHFYYKGKGSIRDD